MIIYCMNLRLKIALIKSNDQLLSSVGPYGPDLWLICLGAINIQQRTYEVMKSLFFIINHDFIIISSGLAIRITINKWSQRSTFNVEYFDHCDCFFDRILNQKLLRIFNDCVYSSTMLIHDFKKKDAERVKSSSIKWMKKNRVRNSKCNTNYK